MCGIARNLDGMVWDRREGMLLVVTAANLILQSHHQRLNQEKTVRQARRGARNGRRRCGRRECLQRDLTRFVLRRLSLGSGPATITSTDCHPSSRNWLVYPYNVVHLICIITYHPTTYARNTLSQPPPIDRCNSSPAAVPFYFYRAWNWTKTFQRYAKHAIERNYICILFSPYDDFSLGLTSFYSAFGLFRARPFIFLNNVKHAAPPFSLTPVHPCLFFFFLGLHVWCLVFCYRFRFLFFFA